MVNLNMIFQMNVSLFIFEDHVMGIKDWPLLLILVIAQEAMKWDGGILRNELGEGSHIP